MNRETMDYICQQADAAAAKAQGVIDTYGSLAEDSTEVARSVIILAGLVKALAALNGPCVGSAGEGAVAP